MAYARQNIAKIQEIFASVSQKKYEGDENITVHAAVGRFAFIYEKIRNAVDYKDEHLIRKAAILRIMKRLLMLERDPRVIAERLIRELIAARYLPNGVMPQTSIDEVSWRIYKLQLIQSVGAGSESHLDWVKSMVAVEIEDLLVDSGRQKSLVAFLYERINDSVKVRGAEMDQSEVQLQTYLACFRMVAKADDEILGYKMLRAFLPEWLTPQNWMDDPRPIAERMVALERRIKLQLRHPMNLKFQRVVKPWAVALNMMASAFEKKPEDVNALLQDPDALKTAVSLVAEERYAKTKARVRRATVRAMIYLFLTKMILALVIEAPAEWYLYNELHYQPLLINLLFPAALMFVVGLFIRVPGPENTARIRSALDELLGEGMPGLRIISAPPKRSAMAKLMLSFVYMMTFVVSFGLISLVLEYISFTWISTLIFLFFLSLVSFFAFRIRLNAREYFVVDDKVTLRHSIVDFFSIPILRAGRWLSLSISRINIFLFFFDFIFEAPYKIFLSLLEEWFTFAKEKKDELQP
ncbi:hypothetical protein GF391_00460 [Candidatus Uhrbacteria bacterium]|nr:hypothetical protein [Candidatus Uhrbacteria bacterium]